MIDKEVVQNGYKNYHVRMSSDLLKFLCGDYTYKNAKRFSRLQAFRDLVARPLYLREETRGYGRKYRVSVEVLGLESTIGHEVHPEFRDNECSGSLQCCYKQNGQTPKRYRRFCPGKRC